MDFPLFTGPPGRWWPPAPPPPPPPALGPAQASLRAGRAGNGRSSRPTGSAALLVSLRIVGSRPHGRQPRRAHPVIVCPCRAAGAAHHHPGPERASTAGTRGFCGHPGRPYGQAAEPAPPGPQAHQEATSDHHPNHPHQHPRHQHPQHRRPQHRRGGSRPGVRRRPDQRPRRAAHRPRPAGHQRAHRAGRPRQIRHRRRRPDPGLHLRHRHHHRPRRRLAPRPHPRPPRLCRPLPRTPPPPGSRRDPQRRRRRAARRRQIRPVVTAGRPPGAPAPFVTVATGRLTTVCLDAAAVASALAAWTAAETAGEEWLVPDPDNLTHAAIAAFERAARWLPRPDRQ